MRLEFTTEPFDLEEPPAHALVAREVVGRGTLDAVDVGPFGNTAEGSQEAVVAAVGELLRRTVAAGATRISLQVSVLGEAPPGGSGSPEGGAPLSGSPDAPQGDDRR